MSDSKSPQVSSTPLSILADVITAVWSPFVLRFPTRPMSLSVLSGLFETHQLLLVSLSPLCPMNFYFSSNVLIFISLFALFYFIYLNFVLVYTPFAPICCIHLLYPWSFRFYHHVTNIYYSYGWKKVFLYYRLSLKFIIKDSEV